MKPLFPRASRKRILIIVQNLPVPFDRRVWLEAQALRREGYDVSVICPRGDGMRRQQVIDGVEIITYPQYAPGGSAAGFVVEYAYSFLATASAALWARGRGRFDVIQACNPPDIFWPLGRMFRLLDRCAFVFDHHDLSPELYESRFVRGSKLGLRGLLLLERATFRTADRVISTNASYARVAVERGGLDPKNVTVVRTGPDPEKLRRRDEEPGLRRGRSFLAAYLGVMGPQDGVDIVIEAASYIVHHLGRTDVTFVLMGTGDSFNSLLALRAELGLEDYVDLMGRVPDETVAAVLSTADVGLSPDPLNPLNDVSTMNKTMEYMAYSIPVVAFDLRETRVSAGEAAAYATPNSVESYARAIVDLLDDPDRCLSMGRQGRLRVERELAWTHQVKGYVAVFDELTDRRRDQVDTPPVSAALADGTVREAERSRTATCAD